MNGDNLNQWARRNRNRVSGGVWRDKTGSFPLRGVRLASFERFRQCDRRAIPV